MSWPYLFFPTPGGRGYPGTQKAGRHFKTTQALPPPRGGRPTQKPKPKVLENGHAEHFFKIFRRLRRRLSGGGAKIGPKPTQALKRQAGTPPGGGGFRALEKV